MDDEIIAFIDNLFLQLDPLTADSKFLNHLAYTMGNPPDFFNDEAKYRLFLKYAVRVYQIRSTYIGYEMIFNMFGYNNITIYEPLISGVRYDDSFSYDNEGENYDSICPPCKPYYIGLMLPESPCLPLASGTFNWDLNNFLIPDSLEKMICFMNPINMKFQEAIPLLSVCEVFKSSWEGELILQIREYPRFDTDIIYDDSQPYDEPDISLLASYTINEVSTNAYTLMAKNLGGNTQPLDFFVFYYNNVVVKTLPAIASDVDATTVRFDAIIPFLEFNGPYDKFQLVSSLGGVFMEKDILVENQTEEISVTLTLSTYECAI
jgi:hypothetical protein